MASHWPGNKSSLWPWTAWASSAWYLPTTPCTPLSLHAPLPAHPSLPARLSPRAPLVVFYLVFGQGSVFLLSLNFCLCCSLYHIPPSLHLFGLASLSSSCRIQLKYYPQMWVESSLFGGFLWSPIILAAPLHMASPVRLYILYFLWRNNMYPTWCITCMYASAKGWKWWNQDENVIYLWLFLSCGTLSDSGSFSFSLSLLSHKEIYRIIFLFPFLVLTLWVVSCLLGEPWRLH